MAVFPGRNAGRIEGDFVVFLIGMRINKPWKLRQWLPVLLAMPRMLKELEADPASGYLGSTRGLWSTGPAVVQYWRSFEHLERFASDPERSHLPAWRAFNRVARYAGDVGIWHEAYKVRAGEYETAYSGMPLCGLAKAGELVPVGSTSTARERMTKGVEPLTPA